MQAHEPEPLGPPEPLRRALRRLGPALDVSEALDRSVLAAAAPVLARVRARRRGRRIALAALPLAAAAALVLLLAPQLQRRAHERAPGLDTARADLDRNGRVDILDAFQLARELEGGDAPGGRDFNGDGHVDRADVDELAYLAVRLGA